MEHGRKDALFRNAPFGCVPCDQVRIKHLLHSVKYCYLIQTESRLFSSVISKFCYFLLVFLKISLPWQTQLQRGLE